MRYTWDLSLLCTDGVWKDKYDKLNEMVDLANNKLENFLDNVDLFLDFIHDYIRINEEIEVIYCYPRRNLDIDLNNEITLSEYRMFKLLLNGDSRFTAEELMNARQGWINKNKPAGN